MKQVVLFLIIAACLSACGDSTQQTSQSSPPSSALMGDQLRDALIGTWQSVSLDITMPTWNNSDSTAYLSANEQEWETTMQLKPVITVFEPDGTYYAEYYDLGNVLVRRPSGTWTVQGDMLIYREEDPFPNTFQQQVERVSDTEFKFTFTIDYDQDGMMDDQGVGISRKTK